MRLFIGFFTTYKLQNIVDGLENETKNFLKGKWIEAQNLHITFQFLGEVEDDKKVDILLNLEKVSSEFEPFDIEYEGLGVFPSMGKPRILWIGVGRGSSPLKSLATRIIKYNKMKGIEIDSKPFYPYVSVCRLSEPVSSKIYPFLRKYKDKVFETDRVDKIALVKSSLTSIGPVYSIVEEFYLRGKK